MATIIAGRAETQVVADRAIEALTAAGFHAEDVTSFYLSAPGQHSEYPIGGDAHHDEGTRKSGKTAATGATVGGVTGLAIGTAAAIPGTIVNRAAGGDARTAVRFGHPSGTLRVGAEAEQVDGQWVVRKALMSRSARVLMEGWVRVPAI